MEQLFTQKQHTVERVEIDQGDSPISLIYQQELLRPQVQDPLLYYLHGRLSDNLLGVIPEMLGRSMRLENHRATYEKMLSQEVRPRSVSRSEHKPQVESRRPSSAFRKITSKSPGTIRIKSKDGRPSSSHIPRRTPMKLSRSLIPSSYINSLTNTPCAEKKPIETYEGEYSNGKRHGRGKLQYPNEDLYKGEWQDDLKNGRGSYRYFTLGVKYKGDWSADQQHGKGEIHFKNSDFIRAEWEFGRMKPGTVHASYSRSLTYDGEMVDAARQGPGKMDYGSAKFTGRWHNDQRNGLGILNSDNFYFEGEFANDTADGPGILVHKRVLARKQSEGPLQLKKFLVKLRPSLKKVKLTSQDIVYVTLTKGEVAEMVEIPESEFSDGRFVSGKIHGAAIAVYGNCGVFKGSFYQGKRSGWGRMRYTDPLYECIWTYETEGDFEGQWGNDKRQGQGKMKWASGAVYEGKFNEDRRHQVNGVLKFNTGEIYSGGWVNDLMHGHGALLSVNGNKLRGIFQRGHPCENGVIEMKDGRKYEGAVYMLEPHGLGMMIFNNGDKYEGSFAGGLPNGNGKIAHKNGDIYDGQWENGSKHGYGTMRYKLSKEVFTGQWRDNVREGFGVLKNRRGEVIYQGEWNNDMKEGFGKTNKY